MFFSVRSGLVLFFHYVSLPVSIVCMCVCVCKRVGVGGRVCKREKERCSYLPEKPRVR